MVVLDVTVPFLGRFQVEDDFQITDYSLLHTVTDRDLEVITSTMRAKHGLGASYQDTLEAALASIYGFPSELLTVNSANEPEVNLTDEDGRVF